MTSNLCILGAHNDVVSYGTIAHSLNCAVD